MKATSARLECLEQRLAERANALEELHLEAAIDAELTFSKEPTDGAQTKDAPVFDDYSNPHSVANCLSPFVPAAAKRIAAFLEFSQLSHDDVLLDLGCGDGRVCWMASKLVHCRSVGLDVSPPCIQAAQDLAKDELPDGDERRCSFYVCDATVAPAALLQGDDSPLASDLASASVVFLYTYPTLLVRLVPLLRHLLRSHSLRRIVTLTYHLDPAVATACEVDDENELQMYTSFHSGDE